MQSVNSSLSVKTFAVAAGASGDSREKKTRNRRTKEERKSMVESFVKKYQNSNNGKFPSLNLTHKEVGGSFYTVREIVREIIQENRVLAPGNLTSKALNLEYYPEEEAEKSFSVDILTPLSIATINYAIDQPQGDIFSLSNEHSISIANPEIIEVDNNFAHQEGHDSQPNVTFVSQLVNGEKYSEISNGAHPDSSKLEYNLIYKEPNLDKVSEVVMDEYSECSSENSGFHQHSVPLCEPSMVNDNNYNGDRSNDMAAVIKSLSASSISLPMSDILSSETNISSDSMSVWPSDPSLASTDVKTSDPEKSQNDIKGMNTTSLEAPNFFEDFDDVKGTVKPFGVDSVAVGRSETTEAPSSSTVSDEASAACPGTQLSLEQNTIDNMSENAEIPSTIAVNEVSSENFNGAALKILDNPGMRITEPVVHPLLQTNHIENVTTSIKSSSNDQCKHIKVEDEHDLSSNGSTRSSGSFSQNESSNVNPFWAAIKSMLIAVVKFWVE